MPPPSYPLVFLHYLGRAFRELGQGLDHFSLSLRSAAFPSETSRTSSLMSSRYLQSLKNPWNWNAPTTLNLQDIPLSRHRTYMPL